MTNKLVIEMVPSTSWGDNVRARIPTKEWNTLRKKSYTRAGGVCEICGETGLAQGRDRALECHEIWQYTDIGHTQKLVGLVALCPNCHSCKHAGRTINCVDDGMFKVLSHLRKVNGWTDQQAITHLEEALYTWKTRSEYKWTVDISWLKTNG